MHKAESYVYRNLEDGPGYVGRSPKGNFVKVASRGAVLTDEEVAALGLDDLKDHTDYDAVLVKADEAGAPVTFRREDGTVGLKVNGEEAE